MSEGTMLYCCEGEEHEYVPIRYFSYFDETQGEKFVRVRLRCQTCGKHRLEYYRLHSHKNLAYYTTERGVSYGIR